jgi:hypothetical protein
MKGNPKKNSGWGTQSEKEFVGRLEKEALRKYIQAAEQRFDWGEIDSAEVRIFAQKQMEKEEV